MWLSINWHFQTSSVICIWADLRILDCYFYSLCHVGCLVLAGDVLDRVVPTVDLLPITNDTGESSVRWYDCAKSTNIAACGKGHAYGSQLRQSSYVLLQTEQLVSINAILRCLPRLTVTTSAGMLMIFEH